MVYNQCPNKNTEKDCKGKFYILNPTDKGFSVDDCECYKKSELYELYYKANIPIEFWNFEVSDISKDFDKKILKDYDIFVSNINKCIVNKVKFWFNGDNGKGKTTISVLMLKEALKAGYTGRIIKSFELIQKLYAGEISEWDELDMIVVDEFDKLQNRDSIIIDFSNIIADYMDKKAMIVVTNDNLEILKRKNMFPLYVMDRLISFEKIIFKGDNNFRRGESIFGEIKEKLK